MDLKSKSCSVCKIVQPVKNFHKCKKETTGLKSACKKCISDKNRLTNRNTYERRRNAQLKSRYKITLDDYREMEVIHNNRCAICNKESPGVNRKNRMTKLCVDHSHETGKVRGLLCINCNIGIGKFFDSSELLKRAIEYIKLHKNDHRCKIS